MVDDVPSASQDDTAKRKSDHLRITLEADVDHVGITTGLEQLRLNARALPGRDLGQVDLATTVFGHRLAAPVLISCMTGGTSKAGQVNRALAAAAAHHGIALGLGSGRVLLQDGDPTSFAVRDIAPDILLLANLGAVQLPQVGTKGCRELIRRTKADGLVLHLNAVQEAVQPGGDTAFAGLSTQIAEVVTALDCPVLVKEVGFGLSLQDVVALVDAGVAGIDVAGAGGTNWATVEGHRDDRAGALARAFEGWGWSTVESLSSAVSHTPDDVVVIASGGLRDGVDAVKCLSLGAELVGFGRRVLAAATNGPPQAIAELEVLIEQMRIATWAVGAPGITALNHSHVRQA